MRWFAIALCVSASFSYSHSYGYSDRYSFSFMVHGPWFMVHGFEPTAYGLRPTAHSPWSTVSAPAAYGLRPTAPPDTTKPDSAKSDLALRDTLSPIDTVKTRLALRDTILPSNCYSADVAEERAVYVQVDELKKPVEKVVQFRIGRDTLYDLVTLKDTAWHLIKHWPLMPGDTLCATFLDSSLSARWAFRSEGVEPVVQNEDLREFTGDIWYYKDVALLLINKTRDYPEKMNIVVGLQPGFDLDRLYLSVKLIHPTAGVKEVECDVRVSNADNLGAHDRLVRVFIPEWTLTEKGKYFLRISHQHLSDRLNGIDFVSYELLTP